MEPRLAKTVLCEVACGELILTACIVINRLLMFAHCCNKQSQAHVLRSHYKTLGAEHCGNAGALAGCYGARSILARLLPLIMTSGAAIWRTQHPHHLDYY